MIYYFSGTGNSKWVAETLADKLQTTAMNLIDCKDPKPLPPGELLGLVFPIYAWDAPEVVYDFLKKLPSHTGYSFALCTCGDETGNAMEKLRKHFPAHAMFSVTMPSNYMIGMRLDTPDIAKRKLREADERLKAVLSLIKTRYEGTDVHKGSSPRLKTAVVAPLFNSFGRNPKSFTVSDACTKCGLCERLCPSGTIKLDQGRPTWSGHCYQCLACVNKCPVEAIDYGKTTKGKGRYYFKGIPT